MNTPIVTLKKGREISILRRHPWVFSGALKDQEVMQEGSIVKVCSNSGETVGFGFLLGGSLRVKIFAFSSKGDESPENLLIENLLSALYLRKTIGLDPKSTNAYRLVNGEGDSLPGLIIDRYNKVAVIQLHHSGWLPLLDTITKLLLENTDCQGVYVKSHDTIKESWRTEAIECPMIISENGIKFSVDFIGGQKTGFFLDQRESRLAVKHFSKDRAVLNLFSYTGGFSAYALSGGAVKATSVDVSEKACLEATHNLELNGLDKNHSSECKDCFKYVEDIPKDYNFIILDPPALTKHRDSINQAIKGYKHLNRSALRALPTHGLLATFSCSQLVSREQFESLVYSVSLEVNRPVKIISRFLQAPCHPSSVYHSEGTYLKGLLLEVL